ncbi:MAG: type II secretion system protein [Verrucomicrobiae bacterium]|nr:type II secretion system protein [Verrucomicrobiae bacterium]
MKTVCKSSSKHKPLPKTRRMCYIHAFTLIELLAVICLISILYAIFAPTLKAARDKAKSIQCMVNLKNIGMAVASYETDHNGWLPHGGSSACIPGGETNPSWKELLAPYLGVTTITKFCLEHGIYHCPSQSKITCGDVGYGDNGFYGGYGWNFLNLGSYSSSTVPWVHSSQVNNPADVFMVGDTSDGYANTATSYNCFYIRIGTDLTCQSSRHNGGGNYLWADKHVSWHSAEEVYQKRNAWYPCH